MLLKKYFLLSMLKTAEYFQETMILFPEFFDEYKIQESSIYLKKK